MNINKLREKPFYLKDKEITWVMNALNSLTFDEKIGQLFFMVGYKQDRDFLTYLAKDLGVGGLMCRAMEKESVIGTVSTLQSNARIPLLIAANLEAGGSGITSDGTNVGTSLSVSATNDLNNAYELGRISAVEGKSVGANYAFAPVVDIDYNFQNPITNTRTFGSSPAQVKRMAGAFVKGCQEQGVATSIKHFPGDGVDGRDQHLVTSINTMNPREWDQTFGDIYQDLIDKGAMTVMAGHISLPEYSKELNPQLKDEDILPASLAREILNDLLREKLNFNGLIITDATTMAGMNIAMPRNELVPKAIENGCDMFLFTKNMEEDIDFMKQGYNKGLLSEKRINEAVIRILGLKASLGLHENNNIPSLDNANKILRVKEHLEVAKKVSDKSITLVKEEPNLLPISSDKYKRILLFDIENENNAVGYKKESNVAAKFIPLLEDNGFEVSKFKASGIYEGLQSSFVEMTNQYDLIIYLCNISTKSNQTTVRIEWENPMGVNVPIYMTSIPTIFISLHNPYHLYDVPRVKTYINTYGVNDFTLHLLIEKLLGKSKFEGISPVDPFCGQWDTRL